MLWLFRVLGARLRTVFLTDLALDLETQFACRQAERKGELLRQAQKLDDQGLQEVADELRQQAANLSADRSLAEVLPALAEFERHEDLPALAASPAEEKPDRPRPRQKTLSRAKK